MGAGATTIDTDELMFALLAPVHVSVYVVDVVRLVNVLLPFAASPVPVHPPPLPVQEFVLRFVDAHVNVTEPSLATEVVLAVNLRVGPVIVMGILLNTLTLLLFEHVNSKTVSVVIFEMVCELGVVDFPPVQPFPAVHVLTFLGSHVSTTEPPVRIFVVFAVKVRLGSVWGLTFTATEALAEPPELEHVIV